MIFYAAVYCRPGLKKLELETQGSRASRAVEKQARTGVESSRALARPSTNSKYFEEVHLK